MIYYKDKNLIVSLSETPNTALRQILPTMTKAEIKDIKKKPLICYNTVYVEIIYKEKAFSFIVPSGYTWDGSSIPRFFWRVIGSPLRPEYQTASLIHDILCENHNYIGNDRKLATKVYVSLLKTSDVNPVNRFLQYHTVDNFQKFCKWGRK